MYSLSFNLTYEDTLLSGTISSPTKGAATAGGPGTQATLTQSNVFSVF